LAERGTRTRLQPRASAGAASPFRIRNMNLRILLNAETLVNRPQRFFLLFSADSVFSGQTRRENTPPPCGDRESQRLAWQGLGCGSRFRPRPRSPAIRGGGTRSAACRRHFQLRSPPCSPADPGGLTGRPSTAP
jgi:hypothetical protein